MKHIYCVEDFLPARGSVLLASIFGYFGCTRVVLKFSFSELDFYMGVGSLF
jgi:hypothetical protein